MLVSAREGRGTIDSTGGQVRIRIPVNRSIFSMLFLCAWLGGWFIGEVSVINQLFGAKARGVDAFLLFWLCGWTIGGGWAIFTLLWNLAGAENITVGQGFISIKKSILGFGLNREYTLSSASNFRVVGEDSSFFRKKGMGYWGYINGPIMFDYGLKTVKFGLGIDEPEARYIIGLLRERKLISDEEQA